MRAYYNEHDAYAAEWLRNLIAAGHIADGDVDERSILDVAPRDLVGFTQCHFFAGIGVWSHALRAAGWADDRPVWTGSCPCQPFSAAGAGRGFADERHLWPAWHHLIRERRPAVVFGEQVASKDTGPWIDLVQDDMEAMGYAFGAVPFPAASVGAPHIRDRLYFVADANGRRREARHDGHAPDQFESAAERLAEYRSSHDMADASDTRLEGLQQPGQRADAQRSAAERGGAAGELADTDSKSRRSEHERESRGWAQGPDHSSEPRRDGKECSSAARELADTDGGYAGAEREQCGREHGQQPQDGGAVRGFWSAADWIACRDGKSRPVEPGTFPLVTGATARVGRLRAYGNAICAPQAAEFVRAVMA